MTCSMADTPVAMDVPYSAPMGKETRTQRSLFGGGCGSDDDESSSSSGIEQHDANDGRAVGRSSVGRRRYRKRKRTPTEDSTVRSHTCRMCGMTCESAASLAAHEDENHAFVCSIDGCMRRFTDEDEAIHHVDEWHHVHEYERWLCTVCDSTLATLHDFDLHRASTHAAMQDTPSLLRRVYVCQLVATCRQVYKKRDKFQQHQLRHHTPSDDGTTFECDRCEATFPTRHDRQLHRSAAHPQQKDEVRSPSFTCEIEGCGKSYSKREHLKRHVLTTHDAPAEKPFKCELCGVRFTHKHGLNRHHASCHEESAEKPYSCDVCLLAFKKKSLLQAHSFVHTGVLPFECGDCGERFLKRYQLVRHERKHVNNRPAQVKVVMCDEDDCGELLFSIEEKHQHLIQAHGYSADDIAAMTESGKPHAVHRELRCMVCQRVFQRMQNLRAHLRTHFEAVDERKLHVCPMEGCGKSYTKKSNVMAHYNAVHDLVKSRRFKCPYDGCDGAFGYKKVLVTHITSIHERIKKEPDVATYSGSDDDDTRPAKRRRGREPVGVMARALGVNQVGDNLLQVGETTVSPPSV